MLANEGINIQAHIFVDKNNIKEKKTCTEGTRAIKGEKNKMMYAPLLCYQDKNICGKDSGLCTH